MLIVFEDQIDLLQDRYVTLELDIIKFGEHGVPKTAYCVVENINLNNIVRLNELKKTHSNLIESYRNQGWETCLEAIEELTGQWNGELDSFYQDLASRINTFKTNPPNSPWDPVIIKKTASPA